MNKTREDWYDKNREKIREYHKQYRKRNKEKLALKEKEYIKANSNRSSARRKAYHMKNREQINAKQRAYYHEKVKNSESRKIYNEKYNNIVRQRYHNDNNFKLKSALRRRIYDTIKRNPANSRSGLTIELLGCTIQEARLHIESLWQPGMSWDNHSNDGWHIDHIKPVNTFDPNDMEQMKQCFHYTNLRPLWRNDNITRPHDGSDIIRRND